MIRPKSNSREPPQPEGPTSKLAVLARLCPHNWPNPLTRVWPELQSVGIEIESHYVDSRLGPSECRIHCNPLKPSWRRFPPNRATSGCKSFYCMPRGRAGFNCASNRLARVSAGIHSRRLPSIRSNSRICAVSLVQVAVSLVQVALRERKAVNSGTRRSQQGTAPARPLILCLAFFARNRLEVDDHPALDAPASLS